MVGGDGGRCNKGGEGIQQGIMVGDGGNGGGDSGGGEW